MGITIRSNTRIANDTRVYDSDGNDITSELSITKIEIIMEVDGLNKAILHTNNVKIDDVMVEHVSIIGTGAGQNFNVDTKR